MSVSKNLKWTICLGGLLAPWLLAGASLPAVAQLNLEQVVAMPVLPITGSPQATLRAFDISWVDPDSHTYALAASALFCGSLINNPNPPPSMLCSAVGSASLPGVLTVNTQTKAPKLLAVGKFAGTCPTT